MTRRAKPNGDGQVKAEESQSWTAGQAWAASSTFPFLKRAPRPPTHNPVLSLPTPPDTLHCGHLN